MAGDVPQLTERQRAVIERIDRRMPIKLIAQELGVSVTRINQHIRALKDIYGAESLNELVAAYRLGLENQQAADPPSLSDGKSSSAGAAPLAEADAPINRPRSESSPPAMHRLALGLAYAAIAILVAVFLLAMRGTSPTISGDSRAQPKPGMSANRGR